MHSLNRVLKSHGFEDMLKSSKWAKGMEHYQNAMRQLKQDGLGYVDETPEIDPVHLKQIYAHDLLDPVCGARTLQNKVQFDIRFYFARRANENVYNFKVKSSCLFVCFFCFFFVLFFFFFFFFFFSVLFHLSEMSKMHCSFTLI